MELANCTVRLGGDVRNTVEKNSVTPAEVLILKKLHGDDGVVNIRIHGKQNRPAKMEIDRLNRIYVEQFSKPEKNVVTDLFPGAAPSLPTRFADVIPAEQLSYMKDAEADAKLEPVPPARPAVSGPAKPEPADFGRTDLKPVDPFVGEESDDAGGPGIGGPDQPQDPSEKGMFGSVGKEEV